ncbi:hypothetical protein GGR56DRAFT_679587 [Xylariaceae sp. FL0804]|nr:hypothetical protein GGR56DRAFT_679587 [Xylariaceae sp. FL0804]
MSARFSAARPKRAGENYARQHHGSGAAGGGEPGSKKVKFDVRNPSALAPDAGGEDGEDGADGEDEEEDVYLEASADVMRESAATKRGAVNIDGYDSDSDREEMGKLHGGKSSSTKPAAAAKDDDDDDDMDMFAGEVEDGDPRDDAVDVTTGKKSKEVRFLETSAIEGQEARSRSGGHVRIDPGGDDAAARPDGPGGDGDASSSDDSEDEEKVALAIQEEDVDAEVGAGGLKRHAPKVEAFNLRAEHEEGRFDEAGNYVRRAADPDAVHDRWMEGISRRDVRRAAEAHERREAEERRRRRDDDAALTPDLLRALIVRLRRGETALEALARLGRAQKQLSTKKDDKKKKKRVPQWKLKKQRQKEGAMDVEDEDKDVEMKKKDAEKDEDPEQARIRDLIVAITDAADKLLGRDRPDIYDRERERLIREHARETGEDWVEPPDSAVHDHDHGHEDEDGHVPLGSSTTIAGGGGGKMWQFRWTDGREAGGGDQTQGPFDGATMQAWRDAGYFAGGVEFRGVGGEEEEEAWTPSASFV